MLTRDFPSPRESTQLVTKKYPGRWLFGPRAPTRTSTRFGVTPRVRPRIRQAIIETAKQYPVAGERSKSFARTSHFTRECEIALNEQINIEYNVSYIYHAMYAYFARDNIYLPGIAKHFLSESHEERGHAELLMDYQITRGGQVELQAITPPQVEYDHPEKGDALYAFELSLSLEKLNNDRLVALHRVAEKAEDAALQDFIEGALLEDQVKSIQEVAEYVAQLKRMGSAGEAVWHFDQMMLNAK